MREGEGWSVCGAPLGLGESIGFVGATLSNGCTPVVQIWIHGRCLLDKHPCRPVVYDT